MATKATVKFVPKQKTVNVAGIRFSIAIQATPNGGSELFDVNLPVLECTVYVNVAIKVFAFFNVKCNVRLW